MVSGANWNSSFAVVIDRRHPDRAALHHLSNRLVVQFDAVFYRVRTGANSVFHAGGAVGMDCDLAAFGVRGVDDGLELIEENGLGRVHALVAAA